MLLTQVVDPADAAVLEPHRLALHAHNAERAPSVLPGQRIVAATRRPVELRAARDVEDSPLDGEIDGLAVDAVVLASRVRRGWR